MGIEIKISAANRDELEDFLAGLGANRADRPSRSEHIYEGTSAGIPVKPAAPEVPADAEQAQPEGGKRKRRTKAEIEAAKAAEAETQAAALPTPPPAQAEAEDPSSPTLPAPELSGDEKAYDDARAALGVLVASKGRDAGKDALAAFGAGAISKLKVADIPAFIKKCEEAA